MLTHAEFKTSWNTVDQFTLLRAGLSSMNTSLIPDYVNDTLPFWYYYSAALSDGTYVSTISPLSCSGTECVSYFFPGGIKQVFPSPPTIQGYDEADGFIVYDTPGYQIDFYPPASKVSWNVADCKIYAVDALLNENGAIGICIRQDGNDLVAGTTLVELANSRTKCVSKCHLLLWLMS